MKTKRFIPATIQNRVSKKSSDYWGMLFISFLFLSAISSFLFANHIDRPQLDNVSSTSHQTNTIVVNTNQKIKS
ncbi:hypothetical protein ABFY09_13000 [Marinomonas sp. 5E14-1]|uniref:hypothetical protein n=1 Tax=Marinomonas sp. 5E14-1 TaxID=3153922 RepID=UPI0032661BE6